MAGRVNNGKAIGDRGLLRLSLLMREHCSADSVLCGGSKHINSVATLYVIDR